MHPNYYEALITQHVLIGMSESPTQSAARPFAALFEQCWDAHYGDGDGPSDFMDSTRTPF